MKVREIHGGKHTEVEVLGKKEIIKIIEKWEEDNDPQEMLKKAGIFQTRQTFGCGVCIEIDTRDGEISVGYSTPGTYGSCDSFRIDLWSITEQEFSDHDCVEGADMDATLTREEIEDMLDCPENFEHLELEKSGGKFKIDWYENTDYIEAEVFVEKALKEDWAEWVDRYSDWLLEDVRLDHEAITEFYQNSEEIEEFDKKSFDDFD